MQEEPPKFLCRLPERAKGAQSTCKNGFAADPILAKDGARASCHRAEHRGVVASNEEGVGWVGVSRVGGEGVVRRNGCPKKCFWRVHFFSAPLRFAPKTSEVLKGVWRKRTLKTHPFGQPPHDAFSAPLAHAPRLAWPRNVRLWLSKVNPKQPEELTKMCSNPEAKLLAPDFEEGDAAKHFQWKKGFSVKRGEAFCAWRFW